MHHLYLMTLYASDQAVGEDALRDEQQDPRSPMTMAMPRYAVIVDGRPDLWIPVLDPTLILHIASCITMLVPHAPCPSTAHPSSPTS